MKIMLVDDNESVRDTLSEILHGILGHDVTKASNGREAADLYMKDDYQIVFSDIHMPQMTGLEFLNVINKTPKFKKTEVVFFTISPDKELIKEALKGGALDIMLKPFSVEQLKETIDRVSLKLLSPEQRAREEREQRNRITSQLLQSILDRAFEDGEIV